jgi:hypothetical protein
MRPPHRVSPPSNWRYRKVWEAVRNRALPELPLHFRSTIQIGGIHATEIYTFGAALSAAIEEEVVRTLNSLREVWDGERTFPNAQFVRQPQRFPDVLLIDEGQDQIIFGIELKSWYLLAKEGEPAQYRNYWWQAVRQTADDTSIRSPEGAKPYPEGRERIADTPAYDPGRNFGRIARVGIIDAYVQKCLSAPLLGIPIQEWRDFFKKAGRTR